MRGPLLLGLLGLIAAGCGSSPQADPASASPSPKSYTATTPTPQATMPGAAPSPAVTSPATAGSAPSDVYKNISGDTPPPGVK